LPTAVLQDMCGQITTTVALFWWPFSRWSWVSWFSSADRWQMARVIMDQSRQMSFPWSNQQCHCRKHEELTSSGGKSPTGLILSSYTNKLQTNECYCPSLCQSLPALPHTYQVQ